MPSIHVHFLPSLIPPGSLRGSAAVVIDLLRASTTIVRALDAGAAGVVPCLEPDEARAIRDDLVRRGTPGANVVLGGERGGVRIPGFDLDNSPARYTAEAVGGRTLVFTTTNGTRALFAARDGGASAVLVGCFNNLAAVVDRLARASEVPDGSGHPSVRCVHIICAGTNGQVSQEDVLCAGMITDALMKRRFGYAEDDQVRLAHAYWLSVAAGGGGGVGEALRASRGGRNLLRLGFDDDIADCARLDTSSVVPHLGVDDVVVSMSDA
jgi:2-phosphosulfolactate phosphatase